MTLIAKTDDSTAADGPTLDGVDIRTMDKQLANALLVPPLISGLAVGAGVVARGGDRRHL